MALHAAYEPLRALPFTFEPQHALRSRLQKLDAICKIASASPADVLAMALKGQPPPQSWLSDGKDIALRFWAVGEHSLRPVMLGSSSMGPEMKAADQRSAEGALEIFQGALQAAQTPLATLAVSVSIARIQRGFFERHDETLKMLKTAFYAAATVSKQSTVSSSSSSNRTTTNTDFLIGDAYQELGQTASYFSSTRDCSKTVLQVFLSILPKLDYNEAERLGCGESLLTVVRFLLPKLVGYFDSNYHVLGVELIATSLRAAMVGLIDEFIRAVRRQLLSDLLSVAKQATTTTTSNSLNKKQGGGGGGGFGNDDAIESKARASASKLLDEVQPLLITVVLQLYHSGYCISTAAEGVESELLKQIETAISDSEAATPQDGTSSSEQPAIATMPCTIKKKVKFWAHALLSETSWVTSLSSSPSAASESCSMWRDCLPPELLAIVTSRKAQRELAVQKYQDNNSNSNNSTDTTAASKTVAQFYENNVYPAWTSVSSHNVASFPSFFSFVQSFFGGKLCQQQGAKPPLLRGGRTASQQTPIEEHILVAGCGSGHHVATLLHMYPNARLVGIDLSSSNLAYAHQHLPKQVIESQKVRLVRKDILELSEEWASSMVSGSSSPTPPPPPPLLFDAIECYGVAHHLADMNQGLASLKRALRPGGVLSLSVYSQPNTEPVEQAKRWVQMHFPSLGRREADQQNDGSSRCRWQCSVSEVQELRNAILSLPSGHEVKAAVISHLDFYATCGVRDMLLHPQVHRLTISQLFDLLKRNGFQILGLQIPDFGFGVMARMIYAHKAGPNDESMLNAAIWEQVEKEMKSKVATANLGVMYNVFAVKK